MFQFANLSLTSSRLWTGLIVCLMAMPASAHAGKSKVNWKPGITLAADVMTPGGTQAQTFPTAQGPTLWNGTQLIPQGDKIRLNVFVSTGGASLAEIRVRLDNTLIADVKSGPWSAVVDTATLTSGHHMFDVWAQATGDPPLDSSTQLLFVVGDPATGVKDSPPTLGSTDPPAPDAPPALPAAQSGLPTNPNAKVQVSYKDASLADAAPGTPVTAASGDIPVASPTVIDVHSAPGSAATQFLYALVRDGQVIQEAATPYALPSVTQSQHTLIRIQERTDTQPGLRPGSVALWVWGVDAQGRPGNPVRAVLILP